MAARPPAGEKGEGGIIRFKLVASSSYLLSHVTVSPVMAAHSASRRSHPSERIPIKKIP